MEGVVRRPANVSDQEEQWIFSEVEVDRPPSVRCGYCTLELERFLRVKSVRFMYTMRDYLLQGAHVVYTASLFMHRFYMIHSFDKYDFKTLAAAATFLACKVEEQPRRLRDVAGLMTDLRNKRKVPQVNEHPKYDEQTSDHEMLQARKDVLEYERVLLRTLAYDLSVTQPVYVLTKIVNKVMPGRTMSRLLRHVRDERRKLVTAKDVIQVGFMLVADTLASTACLLYRPHVIAATVLVLACAQLSIPLPNRQGDTSAAQGINRTQDKAEERKEEGEEEEEEEGEIDSDEEDDEDEEREYWLDWLQVHPDDMAGCAQALWRPYAATRDEFVRTEAAATLDDALRMIKALSPPIPKASSATTAATGDGESPRKAGTVPAGLVEMLQDQA